VPAGQGAAGEEGFGGPFAEVDGQGDAVAVVAGENHHLLRGWRVGPDWIGLSCNSILQVPFVPQGEMKREASAERFLSAQADLLQGREAGKCRPAPFEMTCRGRSEMSVQWNRFRGRKRNR
jgi:hypothetical protein